jgi:hypothetical protein
MYLKSVLPFDFAKLDLRNLVCQKLCHSILPGYLLHTMGVIKMKVYSFNHKWLQIVIQQSMVLYTR